MQLDSDAAARTSVQRQVHGGLQLQLQANNSVKLTALPWQQSVTTMKPQVVAVIASCNRAELLGKVSLPSILQQTVLPKAVIVVDDSKDAATSQLTQSAALQHKPALASKGTDIIFLRNTRTPGASGAWNTGIYHSMEQGMLQQLQSSSATAAAATAAPERDFLVNMDVCTDIFIAILDDDDCWESNHIEACLAALQRQQQPADANASKVAEGHNPQCSVTSSTPESKTSPVHMVVSGIIRHVAPSQPLPDLKDTSGVNQPLPAPGPLSAALFLAGNPHIQGSNMFIRLDKRLQAGCLNEWLPSTTDRDLCIRLAAVGTVIAVTNTHTVHHFAPKAAATTASLATGGGTGRLPAIAPPGANLPRLSDPCNIAKLSGLHRFHLDLWGPFMTTEQQRVACRRAQQLFGINLGQADLSPGSSNQGSRCTLPGRNSEPLSITAAASGIFEPEEQQEPRQASTAEMHAAAVTACDGGATDCSAQQQQQQPPLVLLVGAVSSSSSTVAGLLNDLLLLQHQGAADGLLGGLEVLLLENGSNSSACTDLASTAAQYAKLGLCLHFSSRSQQLQLAKAGLVPPDLAGKLAEAHSSDTTAANNASTCVTAGTTAHCQQGLAMPVQLPIGDMRTLLQLYLSALLQQLPSRCRQGTIVWVLDDDKRLVRDPADASKLDCSFLRVLQQIKSTKAADIALGCDAGAPPLPAAACVRLGLTDVVSNLQLLAQLPSAAGATGTSSSVHGNAANQKEQPSSLTSGSAASFRAAAASRFNRAASGIWPDIYYDLTAAHSSHLDVPLRTAAYELAAAATAAAAEQDARRSDVTGTYASEAVECFRAVAQGMLGLRQGVPWLRQIRITAPTILTPQAMASITSPADRSSTAEPSIARDGSSSATSRYDGNGCINGDSGWQLERSVHRGGSTFILNPRALRIPQHALPVRRSDMLWCLSAEAQGMAVMRCKQLVVWHNRALQAALEVEQQCVAAHPVPPSADTTAAAAATGTDSAAVAGADCSNKDNSCFKETSAEPKCGDGSSSSSSSTPTARLRAALVPQGPQPQGPLAALKSAESAEFAARFFSRLTGDVQGHSLYMAVQDGMHRQLQALQSLFAQGAKLSSSEVLRSLRAGDLLPALQARRLKRATAFAAAFRRIQGLLYTLQQLLHNGQVWWAAHPAVAGDLEIQRQELLQLQAIYTTETLYAVWQQLLRAVNGGHKALADCDLTNLSKVLTQLTAQHSITAEALHLVHQHTLQSRQSYCKKLIVRSSAASNDPMSTSVDVTNLIFLGSGGEGLVFTDRQHLYKVCLWGSALQRSPQQPQLLLQLQSPPPYTCSAGAACPTATSAQQAPAASSVEAPVASSAYQAAALCSAQQAAAAMSGLHSGASSSPTFQVSSAQTLGPQWLLQYGPYTPGVPLAKLMHNESYLTTHRSYMCSGAQLLNLARRCLSQPVVCCNVHPKNLLLVQLHPETLCGSHQEGTTGIRRCEVKSDTAAVVADDDGRTVGLQSSAAAEAQQLLLLDLGCDWVPTDPAALFSMLARLYACWRWWRREDLEQLLSAATKLVRNKLQQHEAATAVPNTSSSASASTAGSCSDAGQVESMNAILAWLQYWCDKSAVALPVVEKLDGTEYKDSSPCSSSSSSSSSTKQRPGALVLPHVDVLAWSEELPELAGFTRFLAAALGCYDDAKGQLDALLLQCTVDRITKCVQDAALAQNVAVLDYGCGHKAKLLQQLHTPPQVTDTSLHLTLVGADPAISDSCPPQTCRVASPGELSSESSELQDVCTKPLQQEAPMLLTSDCSWAAKGAGGLRATGYDVVVCSLVLCVIEDRQQYNRALDDVKHAVKHGTGRLLLAVCNPFYTFHGNTPFQTRHTDSAVQDSSSYNCVCQWTKQVGASHANAQHRKDVHRPYEALLHDLARRGFALEWARQTESASTDRPDEFNSDFLLLSLLKVGGVMMNHSSSSSSNISSTPADHAPDQITAPMARNQQQQQQHNQPSSAPAADSICVATSGLPAVSCLIKVCLQDAPWIEKLIPDLVSKVDLPKHPVAESVVVVDPHPGTFLRQVHSRSMQTHQQPLCSSTASGCKIDASQVSDSGHEPGARLQHLLHLLKRLQALGWIDRIVVANAKGSEKAQEVNRRWFGLSGCSNTHALTSVTPTLQGIERCKHDLILQLDVDLLLTGSSYQASCPGGGFPAATIASSRRCSSNLNGDFHCSGGSTLSKLVAVLQSDSTAVSISLPSLPISRTTCPGSDDLSLLLTGSSGYGSCALTSSADSKDKGWISNAALGGAFCASFINPATGQPWRTEVRGSLIDRAKLNKLLPLPAGDATGDAAQAADNSSSSHPPLWYRAVDAVIAASAGSLRCYRPHYSISSSRQAHGGNMHASGDRSLGHTSTEEAVPGMCFLHPPNQPLKESTWGLALVKSALHAGCWPMEQVGKVDVVCGRTASTVLSVPQVQPHKVSIDTAAADAHQAPELHAAAMSHVCDKTDDSEAFMNELAGLWGLPRRPEPLVVVVCSRNVSPRRLHRCLESLVAQDWQGWGLVLVDDASTDASCTAYQQLIMESLVPVELQRRVTHLCWQGNNQGMLFNDVIAIRHVCTNPDTVIVTLDADDMLLRHDALRLVLGMHTKEGHDFVTGGHLRTDKVHCGPGYNTGAGCVTFAGPHRQRELRGAGNVWQHLRSFQKRLFDAIPDGDLRMLLDPYAAASVHATAADTAITEEQLKQQLLPQQRQQPTEHGPGSVGYYYELANDWAFTVPMVDLASKPGALPCAVYLYEPSWPRQSRAAREAVIDCIMRQPPMPNPTAPPARSKIVAVVGDSNLSPAAMKAHRIKGDEAVKWQLAEQVGRCLVDSGYRVLTGGLDGVMSAALKGARSSLAYHSGDTVAILPGNTPTAATPYADIAIPTGLGEYRNGVVGRADAVIVIGGGAGTLQEVAVAWACKRPVVALSSVAGTSSWVAGTKLDSRGCEDRKPILQATTAEEAVCLVSRQLKLPT